MEDNSISESPSTTALPVLSPEPKQTTPERDPVFNVGDQVCVTTKTGQVHAVKVRWKGIVDATIHPRRPFMYGIEYKSPIGKHNGRGLFHCKANHGSLVLAKSLSAIQQVGNLPKRARHSSESSSKATSSRRGSFTSSCSNSTRPNSAASTRPSSRKVIKPPLKPLQPTNKAQQRNPPGKENQPSSRPAPVKPQRPEPLKKAISSDKVAATSAAQRQRMAAKGPPLLPNKSKSVQPKNTLAAPKTASRGRTPTRESQPTTEKAPKPKPHQPTEPKPSSRRSLRRSCSVPPVAARLPATHRLETPKKLANGGIEDIENSMANMNLSKSVKRHVIYHKSKFTPDLKYRPVVSGIPFARNTPKKKVYRSRSRDPLMEINSK